MTKILVIEDEAALLEEILDILSFEGFDVVGAPDGVAGVQAAFEHMPDLVVCDIMMPRLDGYGVLLQLRSESATSLMPLIFLTAKADRDHLRYGMELGADDYLTKPFTNAELLAAIRIRLGKQAAVAQEYNQRFDELRQSLVYTLPHELRTPLTGILGYGEMLLMDARSLGPDQVEHMAQMIVKAGTRLYRLIENFLLYSQLELLKVDPERIIVMGNEVTNAPGMVIEQIATEKAVQVDREADLVLETTDMPVLIAENNFKKIIDELVDNAFKFSAGGTKIKVTGQPVEDGFLLSVTDNGRGMTADQIARVGAYMQFERKLYEQQGSGLGLIIAKRLIELHHGQINIKSMPQRGTQVSVILPVR